MRIQRLFIYPVKSILPVEVPFAEITSEGFRFDRQFILIKDVPQASGHFAEYITIKTLYSLCLFQPFIDDSWSKLTIKYIKAEPESSITIPLLPSPLLYSAAKRYDVCIFGTPAIGIDMGDGPAKFFSQHLDMPVRLLFIGGSGRREIPGAAYVQGQRGVIPISLGDRRRPQGLRFADAAPFLVTSVASENDARARLPASGQSEDIIIRFRPNIHIDGGPDMAPFAEDDWRELRVYSSDNNAVTAIIRCIFKTTRCLSLNVDLDTGKRSPRNSQLYGLLARDRRVSAAFPQKPVFGQYACAAPSGAILRVGDMVQVTESVDETQPTASNPTKT